LIRFICCTFVQFPDQKWKYAWKINCSTSCWTPQKHCSLPQSQNCVRWVLHFGNVNHVWAVSFARHCNSHIWRWMKIVACFSPIWRKKKKTVSQNFLDSKNNRVDRIQIRFLVILCNGVTSLERRQRFTHGSHIEVQWHKQIRKSCAILWTWDFNKQQEPFCHATTIWSNPFFSVVQFHQQKKKILRFIRVVNSA
jgi:hypothetical protein